MRRLAPSLTAALIAGLGAAPVPAAERWDVWFAGLRIGEVRLEVEDAPDGWRATAEMKAAPVFDLFAPASGRAEARGLRAGGAVKPALFEAEGRFGDGVQRVTMRHAEGAPPAVEAEPALRLRDYDPAPATLVGAMDPLTAVPGGDPCGRSLKVWDTRRRFDLALAPGTVERDGRLRCEGAYVRVAGFKAKHMALPPHRFTTWWRIDGDRPRLERALSMTGWGAATLLRRP